MKAVDVETASAIERLGERIDTRDTSVRGVIEDRISALDLSLRTYIREVEASVRGEIADLRVELHEGLEQSRRHSTILNESTREDIRFVAEAVANLTVKIDSLRR
jgi:hypothetical protein